MSEKEVEESDCRQDEEIEGEMECQRNTEREGERDRQTEEKEL